MPEGDSVHRLAHRLAALEGRVITHSQFRVPELATADLAGRTIDRVWAWGKNLFWDCVGSGDVVVLHTHLRMEGTWRIHPVGTPWTRPGHTARVVVRVAGSPDPADEVELVGHELGRVELFRAEDCPRHTLHLGPDPLAEDWDQPGRWPVPGRDEAIARLTAAAEQTLGEALLDQSVLAGIGNEYRNEICFLLGSHPAGRAGDHSPAEVLDLAARLMQANRIGPQRVFTGINRPGESTFVFGRNHRPCRRCGTPIQQASLGDATSITDPRAGQERIIWWCPTCQPVGR